MLIRSRLDAYDYMGAVCYSILTEGKSVGDKVTHELVEVPKDVKTALKVFAQTILFCNYIAELSNSDVRLLVESAENRGKNDSLIDELADKYAGNMELLVKSRMPSKTAVAEAIDSVLRALDSELYGKFDCNVWYLCDVFYIRCVDEYVAKINARRIWDAKVSRNKELLHQHFDGLLKREKVPRRHIHLANKLAKIENTDDITCEKIEKILYREFYIRRLRVFLTNRNMEVQI